MTADTKPADITIVALTPAELERIDGLRRALWPDSPISDLQEIVARQPDYVVLAALDNDRPVGFAELSVRHDYVNGCEESPVAFLEGIYVAPDQRRTGLARALVEAAQRSAAARGITELASDALLDNHDSHAFHRAAGFAETERVVYFRRTAGPGL